MRYFVKINEKDNVAIAVRDLAADTEILPGLVLRQDIPQAHKIALRDIPEGGEIVRYGVVLGYALSDIPAGSWINEKMLRLPPPPLAPRARPTLPLPTLPPPTLTVQTDRIPLQLLPRPAQCVSWSFL